MATTSIAVEETPLVRRLLRRADDALILGHRLSEWTGHGPVLEEELALANVALDLIGQARALYEYAGSMTGHTEDQLAYLRDAPAWRNCLLVELPNGDFAFTIARLLLFAAFADAFWRSAIASSDSTIAAIVASDDPTALRQNASAKAANISSRTMVNAKSPFGSSTSRQFRHAGASRR